MLLLGHGKSKRQVPSNKNIRIYIIIYDDKWGRAKYQRQVVCPGPLQRYPKDIGKRESWRSNYRENIWCNFGNTKKVSIELSEKIFTLLFRKKFNASEFFKQTMYKLGGKTHEHCSYKCFR